MSKTDLLLGSVLLDQVLDVSSASLVIEFTSIQISASSAERPSDLRSQIGVSSDRCAIMSSVQERPTSLTHV